MADSTRDTLDALVACVAQKNPQEATKLVDALKHTFESNLTAPQLDHHISTLFGPLNGIQVILESSMHVKKSFDKFRMSIIKLCRYLVSVHHKELKASISVVLAAMELLYSSSKIPAVEKRHCLILVIELITCNVCDSIDFSTVIHHLLHVFNHFSAPPMVMEQIMILLGLIAKKYPENINKTIQINLYDKYLEVLEKVILKQENFCLPAMRGALEGLSQYLVNFAPNSDTDESQCKRIYDILKYIFVDPTRRQPSLLIASFALFRDHSFLFKQFFLNEYIYWDTKLKACFEMSQEIQKHAFTAIDCFYIALADAIKNQPDENSKSALIFIIGNFKSALELAHMQLYWIEIAIRGFGILADVAKTLLANSVISNLLTLIQQRTELTAQACASELEKGVLEHLPTFVKAVSEVMVHLMEISPLIVYSLQTIVVHILTNFHLISTVHHETVIESLLVTFYHLETLDVKCLRACIIDGVIATCSHKLIHTAQQDWGVETHWKANLTYKNYLPLWTGLLQSDQLYIHFSDALLICLNKLDLRIRKRSFRNTSGQLEEYNSCDPYIDSEPINPHDFVIFINTVDFYNSVWHSKNADIHHHMFPKCLSTLIEMVIHKVVKYPLVSSFHKLMGSVFSVCRRISYCWNPDDELTIMVIFYLKRTAAKALNSNGELQVACMQVIFHAPDKILCTLLNELATVFVSALDLGRQLLRLAYSAVSALERLCVQLDQASLDVKDFLRQVLPSLDTYLQSKTLDGEQSSVFTSPHNDQHSKKIGKKTFMDDKNRLQLLQQKILLLLGTLEPEICLYMLNSKYVRKNNDMIKWNVDQCIPFHLFDNTTNPIIYLDSLLPRIASLALYATDQNLKTPACELLHAVIVYVVGIDKHNSNLWKPLFEHALLLGCDTDLVAQQIFAPLLMQLIRYMTKIKTATNSGALETTLDCLMATIAHPTNNIARDMAASCLREYVKNSIDQAQDDTSINLMDSLISRLQWYCLDSDAGRRIGAALIFNNLYCLMRSNVNLIDKYWISLLHMFAINFQTTETLAGDSDLEYVAASLDHIEKVFEEQRVLLNSPPSQSRICPQQMREATLLETVNWLLKHCGAREQQFRLRCAQLVTRLSSNLNDCSSINDFLRKQSIETLQSIFEKNRSTQNDDLLQAYGELLSSLDGYLWLIDATGIEFSRSIVSSGQIYKKIDTFLCGLYAQRDSTSAPETNAQVNSLCIQCQMQIVNLISRCPPDQVTLNTVALTKFIIALILDSKTFDFRIHCKRYNESLDDSLVKLINTLEAAWSEEHWKPIIEAIINKTGEVYRLMTSEIQTDICDTQISPMKMSRACGIKLMLCHRKIMVHEHRLLLSLRSFIQNSDGDLAGVAVQFPAEVQQYANTLFQIAVESFNESSCDQLIDCILDDQPLRSTNGASITSGEKFITYFAHSLFICLIENVEEILKALLAKLDAASAQKIIKLLTMLLEFVRKQSDDGTAKNLLSTIARAWQSLHDKLVPIENGELLLIELMIHMSECKNTSQRYLGRIASVDDWLIKLLSSKNSTKMGSLDVKARAIRLIPWMTDNEDDSPNINLLAALEILQVQHIPLISTEFPTQSTRRAGLTAVIRALLTSLRVSLSHTLLEFIIQATSSDPNHYLETEINDTICAFIKAQTSIKQQACIDIAFNLFANTQLEPNIRQVIVRRFVVAMLKQANQDCIEKFYTSAIRLIQVYYTSQYIESTVSWHIRHALVGRIAGYHLVEVLFTVLPKEIIKDSGGIERALGCPEGQIIPQLTKYAYYARKSPPPTIDNDPDILELYRLFQCQAYLACCSIFVSTQLNPDFYDALFVEQKARNEFIWCRLINCKDDKLYESMGQSNLDTSTIKQRIVSLRTLENCTPKTVSYLKSVSILESSLSHDITHFDFTDIVPRAEKSGACSTIDIWLESTKINDHEVMAVMCAVIRYMYEKKITPVPEPPALNVERVPKWVNSIANTLGSRDQPRNARAFLTVLVNNCRDVFRMYANALVGPLLQIIVDAIFGHGLNSTVIDIVLMLLSWTDVHKPTSIAEQELAAAVISIFMKNAYHETKKIYDLNLEIIKEMIEIWPSEIEIPSEYLFNLHFEHTAPAESFPMLGIQLNGIIFANDRIPWSSQSVYTILNNVIAHIHHQKISIWRSAAELAGLILNKISTLEDEATFHDGAFEVTELLSFFRRTNKSRFLTTLYCIHKHHAPILDTFLIAVAAEIPIAPSSVKRMLLEMLLARLHIIETNLFGELQTIGIHELLYNREYQLLATHIVNKAIERLTPTDIDSLLKDLELVGTNPDPKCRAVLYEIMIYLREHIQQKSDGLMERQIFKKATTILLDGLTDKSTELQEYVFNYWSTKSKLPESLHQRFITLLKGLYFAQTQCHFLSYSSQLLLDISIRHPSSRQQLFEEHHFDIEQDIKLQEYSIDVSKIKRLNYSMPPLFVATLMTERVGVNLTPLTNTSEHFEPTIDPFRHSHESNVMFTLQSQSWLTIDKTPRALDRRSQITSGAQRLPPSVAFNKFDSHLTNAKLFSDRYKEVQDKNDGITLFRRYRNGFIPDFQINHLAILLPLQALAKQDALLGRQLLVTIFTKMFESNIQIGKSFWLDIGEAVHSIIEASTETIPVDSMTFATFVQLALTSPDSFDLMPEAIVSIARGTALMPLGALYLEARIASGWENDHLASTMHKYSTTSVGNTETHHWLKLSELYYWMGDADVVRAIRATKLSCTPTLIAAMLLEDSGHYMEALQKNGEVRTTTARSIDRKFSYQSSFACLENMGMWSELAQLCHQQFTQLEELWTDEWNKTHILPSLIDAEVRQIIAGKGVPLRTRPFIKELDKWMRITDRAHYLRNNFGDRLMMLNVANNNFRAANVYAEDYLRQFLLKWSVITESSLRKATLLNGRNVAEIYGYIRMLMNVNSLNCDRLQSRVSQWQHSTQTGGENLTVRLCAYRTHIADKITVLYPHQKIATKRSVYSMKTGLIEAVMIEKNFQLVDSLMNTLENTDVQHDLIEFKLIDYQRVMICASPNGAHIELNSLIEGYEQIQKEIATNNLLQTFPDLFAKASNYLLIINVRIKEIINSCDEVMLRKIYQLYRKDADSSIKVDPLRIEQLVVTDSLEQVSRVEKSPAQAYYLLAKSLLNTATHIDTLLFATLNAMRLGSSEAFQLFPSILIHLALCPASYTEWSNIPTWMFLRWIPQLLIRNSNSPVIQAIITCIFNEYPKALTYPIRLMANNTNDFINELIIKLNDSLITHFIDNIALLCVPEKKLLHHLRNLRPTANDFDAKLEILEKIVFTADAFASSEHRRIYNYREAVRELRQHSTRELNYSELLRTIEIAVNDQNQSLSSSMALESLSPWLANYHWLVHETTDWIEIPGQYNGNSSGNYVQNVRIVKFGKRVSLLRTLRLPMRVTIYGSNGNSYDYLAKYGEALSRDAQVQQMFTIMADAIYREGHDARLSTYLVVPLSEDFGIIEWLENTQSLRYLITDCIYRLQREKNGESGAFVDKNVGEQLLNEVIERHRTFIDRPSRGEPVDAIKYLTTYGKSAMHYSRTELTITLHDLSARIPKNIFARILSNIATSPEAYFALRRSFATSMAATNIAQWTLGIGDRHLSNLLLNTSSGAFLGVDFEMAFGSGTRDLPVPEMIPFRMTPHLVAVMEPFGTLGTITKTMEHCLRSIQKVRHVLTACSDCCFEMQNEPSENRTQLLAGIDRKLTGANPMVLIREDLEISLIAKHCNEYLNGYIRILNGHPEFSRRNSLPGDNLTVEQQVSCLIEIATDMAILAVTFSGFQPWV